MKKRLASMSKERTIESISAIYAKHRSPLAIDEGEIDIHIDNGPLTYNMINDLSSTQRNYEITKELKELKGSTPDVMHSKDDKLGGSQAFNHRNSNPPNLQSYQNTARTR